MGGSWLTVTRQVLAPTLLFPACGSLRGAQRVLPGLPAGSCRQNPRAAALPALRNVIHSMKMQH